MSLLTPLNILLDDAKNWTKNWQSANPNHAKAFLIPALEILSCMQEMGVIKSDGDGKYIITDEINNAGVRAYLGINPNETDGFGEKLLIVATRKDKNGNIIDIVEGRTVGENEECGTLVSGLIGSGVFDFTRPCPSNCDPKSPLFHH